MADTKKHAGYDAIREIIEKMRAAGFDSTPMLYRRG
jgi:hypothetical protein